MPDPDHQLRAQAGEQALHRGDLLGVDEDVEIGALGEAALHDHGAAERIPLLAAVIGDTHRAAVAGFPDGPHRTQDQAADGRLPLTGPDHDANSGSAIGRHTQNDQVLTPGNGLEEVVVPVPHAGIDKAGGPVEDHALQGVDHLHGDVDPGQAKQGHRVDYSGRRHRNINGSSHPGL
ncbi:hypothetical protein FQZ97_896140 [compost metagenome]